MSKPLLLLTTLAIALIACKKDPSATGADAKRATGLYAKGYNALLAEPRRLIRGYFSTFPADQAPAFDHQPTLSTEDSFVTQSVDEARKAFADAHDAAPSSLASFDPAATAALAATEATLVIYRKAQKYYAAQTYKDDHGELARQLHGELGKSAHDLDQKLDALAAEIEKVEDVQAIDEIKRFADDKDYSYWFRFYTHEAKQVVTALDHGGAPAITAAIDNLSTVNVQFAAFVGHKGPALSSAFTGYAGAVDDMRAETVKLRRLVTATNPSPTELDAAETSVIGTYNRLVDIGNTLYQVEGVNNLHDK